jgi:hypothetical protein
LKTSASGKLCCSASDVQPIVRSGRLQLKVESHAETLAQRQSPSLVDAAAEWRVDHQLHASTFIEEPLGNHGRLRRDRAQHCPALQNIFDRLLGAESSKPHSSFSQPPLLPQPGWAAEKPTGDVRGSMSLISCRNPSYVPTIPGCAPELHHARTARSAALHAHLAPARDPHWSRSGESSMKYFPAA